MIKWKHILDSQPQRNESIVRLEQGVFGDEWRIRIYAWQFSNEDDWKDFVSYGKSEGWPSPDYWWVPLSEFSLPSKEDL